MNKKERGRKIRRARIGAGISQNELGRRIGTGQQTISNYENGLRTPDLDTAKLIADALNMDMEALFFDV